MNALTQTTQLVEVFSAVIGDTTTNACNARTLHAYLENERQFADWIKQRVEQYGFQENQDFSIVSQKSETIRKYKTGERKGVAKSTDYIISLDMAKELSMVENNDKGREARRYFINMEKKALSEAMAAVNLLTAQETLTPSECQTIREIISAKLATHPDPKKGYAEIYGKLQNKFRVNSYNLLPRTQMADVILYITGMNKTEPLPVEYLTSSDRNNLTRLVQMVSSRFSHNRAARHAIFKALRDVTHCAAPQHFEVKHLPAISTEMGRIFNVIMPLRHAIDKAEETVLKRIIRNHEEDEGILKQLLADIEQAAIAEKAKVERVWASMFVSDRLALLDRRPNNNGYLSLEELAA